MAAIDRNSVAELRRRGLSSTDIAQRLGCSKAGAAKVIKELEADGTVDRFHARDVERARARANDPHRATIVRMRRQGLSYPDIAKRIGCAPGTVFKKVMRLEREGVLAKWGHEDESLALTRYLQEHMRDGDTLDDLTVLSAGNDPFTVHKRAEAGRWFAEVIDALDAWRAERGLPRKRRWHNRGIRYGLLKINFPMPGKGIREKQPDGTYRTITMFDGSEACWDFINEKASQAARWMGLVPFDRIMDKRNKGEPVISMVEDRAPVAATYNPGDELAGVELRPQTWLDVQEHQPYRIALVTEKSDAAELLGPLAERYRADLFASDGEMTDTMIHRMAEAAVRVGKPLVVIYFSDADPAGYQMPISVSRKLQALQAAVFPTLEFTVVSALLTPEQARSMDLPGKPLKPGEARADRWYEAWGIEQIELDALDDNQFIELAVEAIERFFDTGLEAEVNRRRKEWDRPAQEATDAAISGEQVRLRGEAVAAIEAYRAQVEADLDAVDLPELPAMPEPGLDPASEDFEADVEVVADSRLGFRRLTRLLKARKDY